MFASQTSALAAATDCQECVTACTQCHAICVDTALYCLQTGAGDADTVRMLFDCAEICQTNARLLKAGNRQLEADCMVCGMVYEQFADECDRFSRDPRFAACAEAMRLCVTACEEFVMAA